VVAKTRRLRKLSGGNGTRDVEARPNRGVALSHENYGLYDDMGSYT
jgi:hypothetical protein